MEPDDAVHLGGDALVVGGDEGGAPAESVAVEKEVGGKATEVRDEFIAIPTPQRYQQPGWYPVAYRITWDPQAKEYRIALTGLARR